jgi:hypothetical protein
MNEIPSYVVFNITKVYIHTYRPRFIPEGVAEVSQIVLRDTQNYLAINYY